jgi:hypothetical protein
MTSAVPVRNEPDLSVTLSANADTDAASAAAIRIVFVVMIFALFKPPWLA